MKKKKKIERDGVGGESIKLCNFPSPKLARKFDDVPNYTTETKTRIRGVLLDQKINKKHRLATMNVLVYQGSLNRLYEDRNVIHPSLVHLDRQVL